MRRAFLTIAFTLFLSPIASWAQGVNLYPPSAPTLVQPIESMRLYPMTWSDFFVSGSSQGQWTLATHSAGTSAIVVSPANHPGVINMVSSATANSGKYVVLQYIRVAGGELMEVIFSPSTLTNTTFRFGLHDATNVADATDGVYAELVATTLSGKTANAGDRSTTGTTYTVTGGEAVWYRLAVQLNADASLASFTLNNSDTGALLWTDSLTTNIPAGKAVSAKAICTESAGATQTMMLMDFIAFLQYEKLTR